MSTTFTNPIGIDEWAYGFFTCLDPLRPDMLMYVFAVSNGPDWLIAKVDIRDMSSPSSFTEIESGQLDNLNLQDGERNELAVLLTFGTAMFWVNDDIVAVVSLDEAHVGEAGVITFGHRGQVLFENLKATTVE